MKMNYVVGTKTSNVQVYLQEIYQHLNHFQRTTTETKRYLAIGKIDWCTDIATVLIECGKWSYETNNYVKTHKSYCLFILCF